MGPTPTQIANILEPNYGSNYEEKPNHPIDEISSFWALYHSSNFSTC